MLKQCEKLNYLTLIALLPSFLTDIKSIAVLLQSVLRKQTMCMFKYSVIGLVLIWVTEWLKIKSIFIYSFIL